MNYDSRDEMMDIIIGEICDMSYKDLCNLAENSGIGVATLYAWRSYQTLSPYIGNICAVLDALGYDVEVTHRIRKKSHLKVVK